MDLAGVCGSDSRRPPGCRRRRRSEKSPPTTLTVAAAADLKFALDDLVKEFEEKNPETKVNVTYGSSGNFFA
jgi:ABC-type molybdate transport system substrate-binding protein